MKSSKVFLLCIILIFSFSIIAYATEEGKAIKEIKFLTKKGLYENALVRADFYLEKNPASLRVRKLKIDLLVKLSRFDEALKNYEFFIRYSKAKKENIKILSNILVPYLKSLANMDIFDTQKRAVISMLCEIKDESTIKRLKEIYAFPPSRSEKIWAASLLAQIGKKDYIPYLRKVAKKVNLSKEEKLYVIFAFSSDDSPLLKKTLLSMLKREKDKEVIAYIYWALTRLGDDHRRELRIMLNRVDGKVKSTLFFLLGELRDKEFSTRTPTDDKRLLPSFYWALYRRGDRSALDELRKFISSKDKGVSLPSIFYIGLIGDKVSIPLLRHKIVSSSDMDIKIASISSIIRIIRKDRIKTDIKIKIGFSVTL